MSDKLLTLAESCRLCPRACGVNRLSGKTGFCGAGQEMLVSYIGLHHGEEPPISGSQGSGTVFFGHCTMECAFCQNWQISQPSISDTSTGSVSEAKILKTITPEQLAREFLRLQGSGAHNINLVSPTQYAPWIAEAVRLARAEGLKIPTVYNTNGYERVEVLEQLGDIVDIYLPDMKYAADTSAQTYSRAPDYVQHNRAAVRFMLEQKGLLQTADDIAVQGIIVRHLCLPGLANESREILSWLHALNPQISISLMSQYSPQHRAKNIPALNRRLSAAEYNAVLAHAETLGLENSWIQELDSQDIFVPDFNAAQPF